MGFAPGDRVHLLGIGTGIVREARGGDRYAVEIKGRIVVAAGRDLERAERDDAKRKRPGLPSAARRPGLKPWPSVRKEPWPSVGGEPQSAARRVASIDLHGRTGDEALAAVERFVNDALLDGRAEVHIIHGRSGGRLKTVVHSYLRSLPAVAAFRLDPHNPGVTIVTFA